MLAAALPVHPRDAVAQDQHHVRLGRGDWLVYDNHRTLHARTGFTGPRWLRGVYFDTDDADGA